MHAPVKVCIYMHSYVFTIIIGFDAKMCVCVCVFSVDSKFDRHNESPASPNIFCGKSVSKYAFYYGCLSIHVPE